MFLPSHTKKIINCDDNFWVTYCPVSAVEKNMLGKQLTVLGIDWTIIKIMIGSMLVMRAVWKNFCLTISAAWVTVVSLAIFQ